MDLLLRLKDMLVVRLAVRESYVFGKQSDIVDSLSFQMQLLLEVLANHKKVLAVEMRHFHPAMK